MKPVFECSILLSCPSDVVEEIEIAKESIKDFNFGIGKNTIIRFMYADYKTDILFGVGKTAQDVINSKIVVNADAVIAIFANKLGTPTEKHLSGTVEELFQLINDDKPVFLFFSSEPPKKRLVGTELKEFNRLDEFRRDIRNTVITTDYSSTDFREKLDNGLRALSEEMFNRISSNSEHYYHEILKTSKNYFKN